MDSGLTHHHPRPGIFFHPIGGGRTLISIHPLATRKLLAHPNDPSLPLTSHQNVPSSAYRDVLNRLRIYETTFAISSSDVTAHMPATAIHVYSVSSKITPPLKFSDIFPKWLGICRPNFACLLLVPTYARIQIFIQLSATLTKLCHIKLRHSWR